jgi:hypothetical protein
MQKDKRTDYKRTYTAKHYDRIELTLPKGQKATVQSASEEVQESVNLYTQKALLQRMGMDDWPALDTAQADPSDL